MKTSRKPGARRLQRLSLSAILMIAASGWTLLGAAPTHAHADSLGPSGMIVAIDITLGDGSGAGCTGFMIGPHSVGVAGHCLYDPSSGGWAKSVTVTPGINGLTAPYAAETSSSFSSTAGWIQGQDDRTDFGVIQLPNDDVGNATGWFSMRSETDADLASGSFTTAGYRADKPWATLWGFFSPQPLKSFDQDFLYYDWNTTYGDSGSPIWIQVGSSYYVVWDPLESTCRHASLSIL